MKKILWAFILILIVSSVSEFAFGQNSKREDSLSWENRLKDREFELLEEQYEFEKSKNRIESENLLAKECFEKAQESVGSSLFIFQIIAAVLGSGIVVIGLFLGFNWYGNKRFTKKLKNLEKQQLKIQKSQEKIEKDSDILKMSKIELSEKISSISSFFKPIVNQQIDQMKDELSERHKESVEKYCKFISIKEQIGEKLSAYDYYFRAINHFHNDLFKKAIFDFDKAESDYLNNDVFWVNKAGTYMHLQEYSKALNCYNKAIDISPSKFQYKNSKSVSLMKLKRIPEASEVIKKLLISNPTESSVHYNMACVLSLSSEDNKLDMLEHLRLAIENAPEFQKMAREDEDFEDYHNDPDFKKLTAEE